MSDSNLNRDDINGSFEPTLSGHRPARDESAGIDRDDQVVTDTAVFNRGSGGAAGANEY